MTRPASMTRCVRRSAIKKLYMCWSQDSRPPRGRLQTWTSTLANITLGLASGTAVVQGGVARLLSVQDESLLVRSRWHSVNDLDWPQTSENRTNMRFHVSPACPVYQPCICQSFHGLFFPQALKIEAPAMFGSKVLVQK